MPESTGETDAGDTTDAQQPVQLYRGPRMVPFLFTGAVLGIIGAGLLHFFGPEPPSGGTVQELILLSVLFGGLGGLLGGAIYLVVERFTVR